MKIGFIGVGHMETAMAAKLIGTEPSAPNPVKLTANFLQASVIEALGEAIALIGKAGIDRIAYVNLLTSTIFTSPAHTIFAPLIAAGWFGPAAFAAPLIGLATQDAGARELTTTSPMSTTV